MIRAVFDANVLVSGIPARAGPLAVLIEEWRSGEIDLALSEHILAEVRRAWSKPYWIRRLSPDQIERALRLMNAEAEVVAGLVSITGIAAHPEDDLVLAAALEGRADYVVTGDRDFLAVGSHLGIAILSPIAMLVVLEDERHSNEP